MEIINQAMLFLLEQIYSFVGSYGWAIVILTVLLRVILWPMNSSQTRSMKKMQELQPKMKELQEKYKDNPQKMQEALMRFYSEHKFNPFAGCLPAIIQLPILLGLFGALNSPQFMALSYNQDFLFVGKLYHTLQSHGGEPMDGTFSVQEGDDFSAGQTAVLHFKNGRTKEQHVQNVGSALVFSPRPVLPGEPVRFRLKLEELGLGDEYMDLLQSVQVFVINNKTRELEELTFKPSQGKLLQQAPTVEGENRINMDILILIVLYGVLTLLYQKYMSPKRTQKSGQPDPSQQMMKYLPLMFIVVLLFIPIPAGVMIYLVVTTAMMFIQTAWIHYIDEKKDGQKTDRPSEQVVDIKPDRA